MLNNEFPPLGGGTGTVNFELFKQFSKYPDIKIDFITSGKRKDKRTEQFSDNITVYKVLVNSKNIHHASNFELIKYTLKASIKAIRLKQTNKYDFSFAWSTVPAGFVSFLLYVFFRLPYYVRVGGTDIPGFEERYKTVYKIISPLIKLIWKKSDLLITKCKVEYDMIKVINSELKIKTIYNGVDTEKFYPKKDKEPNTPLQIICSARLIKRKGQDILIKVVAQLKEKGIFYHVDFVGDGDEKDNYKQLAEKLAVNEQVVFKGYVAREKMRVEYLNADLFVLPSYNEGMSNALLEAMACGLPVIVTDVGGTEELVEDGVNGFVFEAGDTAELKNILSKINSQQITDMEKKSREKAFTLSWTTIVGEYINLFRKDNLEKK